MRTDDFTIVETVRIWGGSHNVTPIMIRWNINNGISKKQYFRIQKHFCGRSGCSCGGAFTDLEISAVDPEYQVDPKLKDRFLRDMKVRRFHDGKE